MGFIFAHIVATTPTVICAHIGTNRVICTYRQYCTPPWVCGLILFFLFPHILTAELIPRAKNYRIFFGLVPIGVVL